MTAEECASLAYTPSSAGIDTAEYDIAGVTVRSRFSGDPVCEAKVDDLVTLAKSPCWEDRVRAEVLRRTLSVTLPDGFPCLYEVADSPSHKDHKHKRPHPWVKSPDINMLHALLPDYQRLWDGYTSQWGPSSRRVFAVGLLDGLHPGGVFRPGATPEQVIGSTMLTHTDMYKRAPEDLRRMHPMNDQWASRRDRSREAAQHQAPHNLPGNMHPGPRAGCPVCPDGVL